MSKVLAFETCTTGCSVAVGDASGILASLTDERLNYQARMLLPMIEETLAKAGLAYRDLDAIVTTTGPGSFTGIRVGLATARALVLGQTMRGYGINTLEALAWSATPASEITSLWDASREQVYMQQFSFTGNRMIARNEPTLMAVSDLRIPGGAECVGNIGVKKITVPHAEFLLKKFRCEGMPDTNAFPLTPLYIREPDAKLPGSISLNQ